MCFFKKGKIINNDVYDLEKSSKLPTYYEKYSKNVKNNHNTFEFQLVNLNEDEFEIYYYGNLFKKKFIVGTDDARSLVVAKDKHGNELVIFDGFTHGYDNLTWQEYDNSQLNFVRRV